MSAFANYQINDLLKENWKVHSSTSSVSKEAKISYLMVEQVDPPKYMWDKICAQLDAEENSKLKTKQIFFSNKLMLLAFIIGTLFSLFFILFYLIN